MKLRLGIPKEVFKKQRWLCWRGWAASLCQPRSYFAGTNDPEIDAC